MYQTEFAKVEYLETVNLVLVTWKKFCSEDDYRDVLKEAIRIISSNPGCNYVADTRTGFENEVEDAKWVFDVFAPSAHAAGCRHIFFIIDRDNSLKDELEGQSLELKRYFSVNACFDIDEVKSVIDKTSI
jgi:hypothetical protein